MKNSLLEWALDEEETPHTDMLPIGNFMQIKKKNEIARPHTCPHCQKPNDGFSCGDTECPYEAPLFI